MKAFFSADNINIEINNNSNNNNNDNYNNTNISNNNTRVPFTDKSGWVPPNDKLDRTIQDTTRMIQDCTEDFLQGQKTVTYKMDKYIKLNNNSNLREEELGGIKTLAKNKDIIIKPFDKGGGVTVLNKTDYITEGYKQLNDIKYYKRLNKLDTLNTHKKIREVLVDMYINRFINEKQLDYLSGPTQFRPRNFYLLPKVHKPREKWNNPNMPPGRPIVSDIDSESYRVSEYVEAFLNPLANKHKSYIKNSYEFVNKIRNQIVNKNSFIVTADVSSLYTNMHIDRSIEAVRKALRTNPNTDRPDRQLLELLEITMKTNDFEFNGDYFLQTLGTAMGKRYAPSLANLYLLDFDERAREGFKIKPLFYFRYLDDIFFIWEGSETDLHEYQSFLNNLIPDIKITLEYDKTENNFLDTTIYKQKEDSNNNITLQTRVFFKETDTHQLLHKGSHHPKHTFRGLIRSQYIRFKRLSSTKENYIYTVNILNTYLKNRGYTYTFLKKQIWDVWYNYGEGGQDRGSRRDREEELLPILTDYWEGGTKLAISYKNIINNNPKLNGFKKLTAYKNSPNLKQLLVRGKLPPRYEGAHTSCKGPRCHTCSMTQQGSTFTSTITNKTYKHIHNTDCSSKNIIYLITCNKCKKQYVGETGRELRLRMTDHRHYVTKKVNTPIGQHFNSPNHSVGDIKVTVIDSLEQTDGTLRMRQTRENAWIRKLQTEAPLGLNERQRTILG